MFRERVVLCEVNGWLISRLAHWKSYELACYRKYTCMYLVKRMGVDREAARVWKVTPIPIGMKLGT